jgi:hypothetical protein
MANSRSIAGSAIFSRALATCGGMFEAKGGRAIPLFRIDFNARRQQLVDDLRRFLQLAQW